MPQTTERPTLQYREQAPTRKRWTRDECALLVNLGVLNGRYELIDGEIVSKMGQGALHISVTKAVLKWLVTVFGLDFARGQSSVDVAEVDVPLNEPEPDAFVTTLPDEAFFKHIPMPNEVSLIVEVSDSSLRYDLTTKADVYARSSFPDYWVVDIPGRRIITHRDPTSDGYMTMTVYLENELVSPLARPDAALRVGSVLPPI